MDSSHSTQGRILVVGGSGKTGRRVIDRLRALNRPFRSGSRSSQPPFDWEDRSTWRSALDGMQAAYVTYYPDIAVPGAPETIGAFARLACELGVRRLVLLSGRGEVEAQRAEVALIESGADWTIVRSSWFMQNFSEGVFRDAVLSGNVALPVGETPEPFVDAEDIADVVTAALLDVRHAGQVYELTGPRLLTFAQAVQEMDSGSGRDVTFSRISLEQFSAEVGAQGVPPDVASFLGYLFTEVLDGRNARLSDGVRRALGREPRDFSDYVRRAAAAGHWS